MAKTGWRLGALLACLFSCVLALAGCASTSGEKNALDRVQYDWSAAIRWGDFEGAWTLVDPKLREEHPLTDLDLERYKQVQVSGYRELGARAEPGSAEREIEIGVVNRHTQVERTLRYTERWRYDAEAKRWWLTSGLPDFWSGN
jgi:hypothetical protein